MGGLGRHRGVHHTVAMRWQRPPFKFRTLEVDEDEGLVDAPACCHRACRGNQVDVALLLLQWGGGKEWM